MREKKTYVSWFVEELRRQLNGDANESLMNSIHWIRTCEIVFYLCNMLLCWLFFVFVCCELVIFKLCILFEWGRAAFFLGSSFYWRFELNGKKHCFVAGVEKKKVVWFCIVCFPFEMGRLPFRLDANNNCFYVSAFSFSQQNTDEIRLN